MNPQIEITSKYNDEIIQFTLSGVNVSLANAIRRTILSDIPLVVFKTSTHEQNKATIITNKSRQNNEILKQRLSCIPIHIKDVEEFPLKNYQLEINVENITDTTMYVTTEDFIIKDLVTGKPINESKNREIFPANDYTGYYIDFVRLKAKSAEEIQGKIINLTSEFDIGTAKEDGAYNVVSTCAYGNTIDEATQEAKLAQLKQKWKDEGKKESEIEFEATHWKLLEGKRIFKKDSFDFVIQSIGIYTNIELLNLACKVMIEKLQNLNSIIEKDEVEIKNADSTIPNCYDIHLVNEDYTIGKVIEYFLLKNFYETGILTFSGFKMLHPHDTYSLIRVAYTKPVDVSYVKGNLIECISISVDTFTKIRKEFLKLVPR